MAYRKAERISFDVREEKVIPMGSDQNEESSWVITDPGNFIPHDKSIIEEIECEVLGAQWVNVRLIVRSEDGKVSIKEFCYSGNFNILWEGEENG